MTNKQKGDTLGVGVGWREGAISCTPRDDSSPSTSFSASRGVLIRHPADRYNVLFSLRLARKIWMRLDYSGKGVRKCAYINFALTHWSLTGGAALTGWLAKVVNTPRNVSLLRERRKFE